GTDRIVEEAYTYVDTSDTTNGGLGGGSIRGSINVTVINSLSGNPVEDAFVLLGNDPSSSQQGRTNADGRVTFSQSGLRGAATLHVAKHCFETTTFVAFDAANVTVFLLPWFDLACADPSSATGGGGGGVGRAGASVSGELIWKGSQEFGPNPWFNVPPP